MAMRLLALDFDGVISDSAPEAFVVALRTFALAYPEHAFPLPESEGDASLYTRFLDLMPLGNRAEDYGVILAALALDAGLGDQRDYDAFYRSLDAERLRAFHKRFYRVRRAWSDADPRGWRARIQPYPTICELLQRRAGDVRLAVATAKDRHSVHSLLDDYGLGALFPEGYVVDKDTGVSKRAHIQHLAEREGCAVSEITFIDDKVNHLQDVAGIGARCLLAGWGYNGGREHEVARAERFPVCSLEGLEAELFGSG
jgi:phosphoglycolate phosphatase-like HAD superfamily hydrolase